MPAHASRFLHTSVSLRSIATIVGLTCWLLGVEARAGLIIEATVGGAPTGANYASFDNVSLGSSDGMSGGLAISFSGTAEAVKGASSGRYAAPYLSNDNGLPFGGAANGTDATTYLSTGIGAVTLVLPEHVNYFGLLWGSVDDYNTLEFWDQATLVASLTGKDIWDSANGDQGVNGSYYVNVESTVAFDRVVARSSQYAFEFDNVAYNNTAVPSPAPWPFSAPCWLGFYSLGEAAGFGNAVSRLDAANHSASRRLA
jgi:hypothetical protein